MSRSSAGTANPTRFVVDASAAAKGANLERHTDAFRTWIQDARTANADLLAPHLLVYELGHFLARQGRLDSQTRQEMLQRLLVGFRFAEPAHAFAHAPPLTYYDASYLALAQAFGATLVTYDDHLANAAKSAKIRVLAPR